MGTGLSFISRPYTLSECKSAYSLLEDQAECEATYGLVDLSTLSLSPSAADSHNSTLDCTATGRVVLSTSWADLVTISLIVPAGGGDYVIAFSGSISTASPYAHDLSIEVDGTPVAVATEVDWVLKSNGRYGVFFGGLVQLAQGTYAVKVRGKVDVSGITIYIPFLGVLRLA